ncbi:DUF397 domain-containing protein [Streptomyces avermitilis]
MHPRPTAPEIVSEQAWFKSSYSDAGQNCVEIATPLPGTDIAIRDSKNPTGPSLLVPAAAWSAFVTAIRT